LRFSEPTVAEILVGEVPSKELREALIALIDSAIEVTRILDKEHDV